MSNEPQISPALVEEACRVWWESDNRPGQCDWARMVQEHDHRVPKLRAKMQAALNHIFFATVEDEGSNDE